MIKVDFSNIKNIINKKYYPLLFNKNRHLVLYGGAGSGKSYFVAQKIIYRMLTEQDHRFLVCRKVEATIRESARAELIGAIESMGLGDAFLYSTTPSGEMTISCLNGNKIIFRGLDNKEKLKSIKDVTGIWLEEASDFTLDDFTQLNLRLRGKHIKNYKQVILSFNPITSTHWLKVRFFHNVGDDDIVLHTTYKDNRFIDSEYIKILESLKKTNPAYYNVYALGEWGLLKGQIYTDYTVVDEMPKDAEVHRWGLDFGFNHPMAWVEIKIVGDDLYVDEVFYKSNYTTSEMIREVKATRPYLKDLHGWADSAEPDRIKELNSSGYKVHKAIKNINAGIDKVKSYNLFITARSINIIKEIGLYSWKIDKEGNPLDVPIKLNDDAMDAMRYGVYIEKVGKMKIVQTPTALPF